MHSENCCSAFCTRASPPDGKLESELSSGQAEPFGPGPNGQFQRGEGAVVECGEGWGGVSQTKQKLSRRAFGRCHLISSERLMVVIITRAAQRGVIRTAAASQPC